MPYGLSFSWRRAVGLSAAQARLSRQIGVPLSASGRERKAGRLVLHAGGWVVVALVLLFLAHL